MSSKTVKVVKGRCSLERTLVNEVEEDLTGHNREASTVSSEGVVPIEGVDTNDSAEVEIVVYLEYKEIRSKWAQIVLHPRASNVKTLKWTQKLVIYPEFLYQKARHILLDLRKLQGKIYLLEALGANCTGSEDKNFATVRES